MPAARASAPKDSCQIVQAQVADVGADDGRRAADHLDGALHVHASHRAAGADEPGAPAALERRAHRQIAVGAGHVGAGAADVDPAVVVDAADVDVDLARGRLRRRSGPRCRVGQVRADGLDQVAASPPQHDDVVDHVDRRGGEVRGGSHGSGTSITVDTQRAGPRAQPALELGRARWLSSSRAGCDAWSKPAPIVILLMRRRRPT